MALVHDWLTGMRGGERVLEALLELFPAADIFTLVHRPGSVSERIEARPIHVPWPGRLPLAARLHRWALPLLPAVAEGMDLRGYDVVVSSSHCVAKGVRTDDGAPHLCYCHTPMRYVWDQYDAYFGPGRASPPVRLAMRLLAPRLRAWDVASTERVTAVVANSRHVRDRIRRCWGRDADVVHPPVDVERFRPAPRREDFYLCLGALVPYKRVDLVVDAMSRLRRRLLVVGDGPERARLRRRAGSTVTFAGRVPDARVADLLGRCRALVHAGVEDFGITLVEAQAAGAPVIALGAGGALETVADGDGGHDALGRASGGVLFPEESVEAVIRAVERFEAEEPFDPETLRARARRFGPERFSREMRSVVDRVTAGAVR